MPLPSPVIHRALSASWLDNSAPVRSEVLIADSILRVGKWKLVVGGDRLDAGGPDTFLRGE